SGQTILTDNLPNTNIAYGAVSVGSVTNVTNSGNIVCAIATSNLTCTAVGATVTLGANTGTFSAVFGATPSVAGVFANPRAAGVCTVDPNNVVAESNKGNNSCSDTVTEAAAPTISKAFGAASIPVGGTTSLSFSINNPNSTVTLTGVAFSD